MLVNDESVRTERLWLRPARLADVDDICRNIADWDVIKMLALPPWPYTRADAEVFVQRSSGLMIELDGEVIGGMGVGDNDGRDFFGYWIGKRFWRKGFATEAALALIPRYFADPEKQELHSAMLADNIASWHLQSKLGFEKLGEGKGFIVSRQAWLPNLQTRLTRDAFESNGL